MSELLTQSLPLSTFGILLTLTAYGIGRWLYRRSGFKTLLQPLISGVILVIATLLLLGVPYETYFASASIIHTLLGTATVALAIPLYQNLTRIRQYWRPLLLTLLPAGVVAAASTVGLAWLFGLDERILLSLAPKSITTPFAIAVSEIIGGYPALSAVCVIFTGMVVTVIASPLLAWMNIRNPAAQGVAIGTIGHGIGTARAFEIGPQCGAFSALSMGLMGLYTSIVLPWVVRALF